MAFFANRSKQIGWILVLKKETIRHYQYFPSKLVCNLMSKDVGIHQLFEAQVERSPDAIAVVFEDQ